MNYLDVCCNNPDNGIFTGHACQLQIGCAEFESHAWTYASYNANAGPKFVPNKIGFRIAGKQFKTRASKEWYGNWCWNRYQLSDFDELVNFVLWMHKRFLYDCTTATEGFYDWFESSHIIERDELAAMIKDLQ